MMVLAVTATDIMVLMVTHLLTYLFSRHAGVVHSEKEIRCVKSRPRGKHSEMCINVYEIHVDQDRGNFRTLVDTVMNIIVPLFVD
jgi:hypothetical protein